MAPCRYFTMNGDNKKYVCFNDEARIKYTGTGLADLIRSSIDFASTEPFHVNLFYKNEAICLGLSQSSYQF